MTEVCPWCRTTYEVPAGRRTYTTTVGPPDAKIPTHHQVLTEVEHELIHEGFYTTPNPRLPGAPPP